jgi:hypothetical protein
VVRDDDRAVADIRFGSLSFRYCFFFFELFFFCGNKSRLIVLAGNIAEQRGGRLAFVPITYSLIRSLVIVIGGHSGNKIC